ncbi:MAG: 50S ribosomal protein L18 [Chitinophagales bacterium]|nr:MAG: 50S ribosomal protein L18 [Chitinophagales bacterium]
MLAKKVLRRNKIRKSIRKKISGTPERPRLAVFRSNREIYAQIIDDTIGHTLVAASTREKNFQRKGTKTEQAAAVGLALAQKAIAAGITQVVFDRGGYLYHGRVKALADGARQGGLKF